VNRVALISFLNNSINTRSLSSYLKQNGYAIICFFCPVAFNQRNLNELTELLRTNNISLVGISLVTDDYHAAITVTMAIKEKISLPVIWGGAHVNVKPDECLRHADMICLGEGEEALLDLVKNYNDGKFNLSTKNIWFKTDNGIVQNEMRDLEETLDNYPFPDFDLNSQFVMTENGFEKLAEKHFNGEYSIMTSRGCPYSCHYCYNSYRRRQYKGKGKYLRKRSVENVIEELVQAKKIFSSLTRINFWDDSFIARNMEDFILFQRLYKERVNLPFFALVEPMAFDYDKIKILRDSGLAALQLGIQTGSERINREVYNRRVSNQSVMEVASQIRELGIDVIYDVIFNNPYEEQDDVARTVNLFLQFPKPVALQGFNLIFYPGAEITDRALKDGYISVKEEVEDYSTIEGAKDSPTSMRGKSIISDRFYRVHYASEKKEYWNTVLSLFAFLHVPHGLMRFFGKSETPLKKFLLAMFVRFYTLAHTLKAAVKKNG
jgi:anaerobic magnesium-protoporphyrin IX monomethyl ester cyclase